MQKSLLPEIQNSILTDKLENRDISITLDNIFNQSKADSGGKRDLDFLKYLLDNRLLVLSESVLHRTVQDYPEEYFLDRYKKMNMETDRHFLCRTSIQEELLRLGIETIFGADIGNMSVLRTNCNYDIITKDLSCIIDVGLTPARNFFKGLTDTKVKNYLVTTYFDEYMDNIVFSVFSRSNDQDYVNAVRDFEER